MIKVATISLSPNLDGPIRGRYRLDVWWCHNGDPPDMDLTRMWVLYESNMATLRLACTQAEGIEPVVWADVD